MIRKFVKSSTLVLGTNVFSKVINFLTLGFLARALGPEKLGFYNAIQNSGNYVNMMSSFGTQTVIQRFSAMTKEIGTEKLSQIFSNAFTAYILINFLAAVVLASSPSYFFDILLDSKGSINYVRLIALLVVLNSLCQLPLYLILGLHEFKKYAIIQLVSPLSILAFSMLLIITMENDLRAAFIALISSIFINAILTGWITRIIIKSNNIALRFALNFKVLQIIFSRGFIYYFGNTLLGAITGLVGISLFYKYLSSEDYGFTRIGAAFSSVLTIVPAAIQPVTISFLSAEKRGEYLKSVQIRFIPFLSTILLVIVSFNMDLILGITFGSQYLQAKYIVFGMILLQIPTIYLGLINNFQVGAGFLNYTGFVATIGSLTMIAASFTFIPWLGLIGYFLALFLTNIISLLMMAVKEYRNVKTISSIDRNSLILNLILIILAYLMMDDGKPPIKIVITLVVMSLSSILFWNLCLSSEERDKLKAERNRISLKRAGSNKQG